MQDILCYPETFSQLYLYGVTTHAWSCLSQSWKIIETWNFWVIVGVWSSPYCCRSEAKQKCQCIKHLPCFVSELSSSTKPAKSDSVQNFGYRGYSNRDIIGTAISFLSDFYFRNICYWINQYLVFIVIPFPVLARQWICLWSYHHFYISVDVYESREVSFHIWILPSSPLVTMTWFLHYAAQSIRKEKSDGQAHLVVGEYWANDANFSRVNEGPDFLGGLGLNKSGGAMNAASPLEKCQANANEWEAKLTR